MLVYGKCECFVMQMFYVCVLCVSCGSSQYCVLHVLQLVNAGRGCKRRPYGRGILQSWSHNCLVSSHECLLSICLPHPASMSAFMICRGSCACTEMLWMCVLYVSFGFKVRPRTFGCGAMGSALLCIFRSRFLLYSAGSEGNRVQVVLSRQKLYVGMVVCIFGCTRACVGRCDGDVICVCHDLNWCSWWWYDSLVDQLLTF